MEAILKKFSARLPDRVSHQINGISHNNDRPSVVLTGSTGLLGSYLLEALVSSQSVSIIYCLNHSANLKQRQTEVNASRGLTMEWYNQRVKFLTTDYSMENLGLGKQAYSELSANAHVIIHNARQVDFNLSHDSYE